jgi:hypothetical protein
MKLLGFCVVFDTAFRFADGAGAVAGDAAADLNGSKGVKFAKSILLAIHY